MKYCRCRPLHIPPILGPVDPKTVADLAGRFGRGGGKPKKSDEQNKSRAVMADVEIVPSFEK